MPPELSAHEDPSLPGKRQSGQHHPRAQADLPDLPAAMSSQIKAAMVSSLPTGGSRLIGWLGFQEATSFFFLLACLIYALGSEPTPPHFSLCEAAVVFFLVMALFCRRFNAAAGIFPLFSRRQPFWFYAGFLFLLCGLTYPALAGLAGGHAPFAVIRDLIAFSSWFLPLVFYPALIRPLAPQQAPASAYLLQKQGCTLLPFDNFSRTVISGALLIGLIFSVRFLLSLYQATGRLDYAPASPEILLELVNVPTVLFSALYLSGCGLLCIGSGRPGHAVKGVVFLTLAVIPILAGMFALQRANLAALLAMVCGLIAYQLVRKELKSLAIVLFLAGVLYAWFHSFFNQTLFLLIEKTNKVGLNNRLEETEQVFSLAARSWTNFLTGFGWGAGFVSPTAGFREITYTHNFFSALLLKTGLLGVTAGAIYMLALIGPALWLLFSLRRLSGESFVLLTAALVPVIINLSLYANYKSFDFALLLLVLLAVRQRI